MRLLLDTHVWLWRLLAPEKLTQVAEQAIAGADSEIHLSPISTWEALVLARKGRVELRPTPAEWVLAALRRTAAASVPLTHEIAMRAEALDGFGSHDPADRFLVAAALENDLTIVTADQAMHSYPAASALW
ncbi:MAG: type II toxin-antitoxin system VapC family toxin [Solirubrobacterales bacterium]